MSTLPYLIAWDAARLERAPKELHGRATPIDRLARAVLRQIDPVVMVLADAGCGKTALVESLAARALAGEPAPLKAYSFLQLDVQQILSDVVLGKIGTAAVADTLGKVAKLPNTVLIVDDFHLLAGQPGYGVTPMVNDMVACFRPLIAGGSLRAILTTIPKEYETRFAADPIFSKRTTLLYVEELSGDALRKATRQAAGMLEAQHAVTIGEEAIEQAVQVAGDRALGYRPPASALRLLDDACAYATARGETVVELAQIKEAARTHAEAMLAWDRPRLRGLETELEKRVLGQPEAIKAVARRIRLTKLELDRKPQRPDGVFLFLGPSGVGKTELAKALAWALYGDLSRLVRIDMSEYAEQHEYAKMIGSPPGYLGYGEEGHLTGPIAKLGHAVVLFDEVEKAHENCHRLMLQLFDEGVLTDGKGRRVDFSQCVVIMTSNLGRDLWSEEKNPPGFMKAVTPREPSAKAVLDYLLKSLPSEFVNRIDDLVPFRTFTRVDLIPIAWKMMKEEEERWAGRGKKLIYDQALIALLVDTGYNARLGARHLSRNLERLVSQPLSECACQDSWPEVSRIKLSPNGETVGLELDPPPPPTVVPPSSEALATTSSGRSA